MLRDIDESSCGSHVPEAKDATQKEAGLDGLDNATAAALSIQPKGFTFDSARVQVDSVIWRRLMDRNLWPVKAPLCYMPCRQPPSGRSKVTRRAILNVYV